MPSIPSDDPFAMDISRGRLTSLVEGIELEISSGTRMLRFPKDLEIIYQRDLERVRNRQMMITLITAILFVDLFLFFDFSLLKDVFHIA
jgi:hypothetical protein